MDGDLMLQCTGLFKLQADDIVSCYWEARRQMVKKPSTGIFDVKDAPHISRPAVDNVDKITEIVEIDRHVSSRSTTQELKMDHKTVLSHLRKVGFKKKLHKLLPHGQTLNLDLYCQQVDRLKLAIDQKWPELGNRRCGVFHQDNVRSHTSVVPLQDLWELGWEVLMHPPYSPYLAPSDYHRFLVLQNFLSDKKLGSREDYENRLLDVFTNKGQDFYDRGIMKLSLKWQQTIQQIGAYLTKIGQSKAC
ncbi:histone-lysine N-methyltransferase SETMAR [Trichonephila clavipes]|nr:histone-lysine N-methyltransferase SETMAR [Trichonephila clavipes]